ncbi:hypothetical protein [Aldersonia kunmingensis]|uniref:hypothetical protein n=1 Tax=Aldersonia kunmingensis TaxID=408066 RepID=UPI000830686A|nr:hypothetical protein [Aldersonia kunmingensis]
MKYRRIAFIGLAASALATTGAGTAAADMMYAPMGDLPANKPIIAPMLGDIYITDDAGNLLQYNQTRNDIAVSLSTAETELAAGALRGLQNAPPISLGPIGFRPGALVAVADTPGVDCVQVIFTEVPPDRRSGNYVWPSSVAISGQAYGYSSGFCR